MFPGLKSGVLIYSLPQGESDNPHKGDWILYCGSASRGAKSRAAASNNQFLLNWLVG